MYWIIGILSGILTFLFLNFTFLNKKLRDNFIIKSFKRTLYFDVALAINKKKEYNFFELFISIAVLNVSFLVISGVVILSWPLVILSLIIYFLIKKFT